MGGLLYESVTPFALGAGEYSVIAFSPCAPCPGWGESLCGGNSRNDFAPAGSFSLVGAGDFGPDDQLLDVIESAPDGGTAALFLAASLAGLARLRRKI